MKSLNVNNSAYNTCVTLQAKESQWGGRKKKVKYVSHLQTPLSSEFTNKLLTGKKPKYQHKKFNK